MIRMPRIRKEIVTETIQGFKDPLNKAQSIEGDFCMELHASTQRFLMAVDFHCGAVQLDHDPIERDRGMGTGEGGNLRRR